MRLLLPLLLVAAAGCGSSSSPLDMGSTQTGPDMATSPCAQSVAAYCGAVGNCKQDLATAMMASSWCPSGASSPPMVTLQHCGTQTLIIVNYADSADHLVYDGSGALVAVFTSVPHSTQLTCVAGPATFAAPSGCDAASTICP